MRAPLALLAVAAAVLGPAAAASAKEIAAVKVCGADGCRDVTDRASMAVTDGGPPSVAPREAAPFYRVRISVTGEHGEAVPGWSFLWVPSAGKIKLEDETWTNPPSTTIDELERLARHVEPLPASKLVVPEPAQATGVVGRTRAPAPDEGGLPTAVWAFLAAGALGLTALLSRGAAAALGRRGGSAPIG